MKTKIATSLALTMLLQSLSATASRRWMPLPNMTDDLVSFNSCLELETHVDKLLSKQEAQFSEGRGDMRRNFKPDFSARAKSLALPTSQSASAPVSELAMSGAKDEDRVSEKAPEKITGTNNQVEKVDEADFVKFNGKHIFQLHAGALKVLKAWPANELNQIASLPLTGQPQEMLLNDESAVVLAAQGPRLKATVIDIAKPSQPRILTEFEIPGQYRTARLIGDTLRIVNQDYDSLSTIWSPRAGQGNNGWLQEETVTRKLNLKSTAQFVGGTQRTLDMIKDCKNIFVPKNVAPNTLTRIITIDLKAKKYEETMAFVQPEIVYASESAIYLSHAGYTQTPEGSVQQTAIHKFSLPLGQTAQYQSSGLVNGHLINQFALDEHNGYLRVATNGTEFSKPLFGQGQWQQISRVQVLASEGKRLKSIGQTADLGKGERLYSARFDGDKGYIVTFRQVDPLFTLDLKNPYRPRVIGELKVPGFSTYIHMLDSKHLLTIGQDADEKTGRTRGLKLSVFDVSNFASPREVKSLIFKSDVSSESSYEHKAFSFHRAKGILAIPASQSSSRNSLLLFQVTTSNIKTAGEINMTDLQSVRRSFFADNFVYAIGGTGVRAASLDRPQTPLATVQFDQVLAETHW